MRQVRPETVIHLAAYAWGTRDLAVVPDTFIGCLATTVNVLTAAAECGSRRVVLPGSLEEPEGPEATPSSPYAAAKWACSLYGRMFQDLSEMEVLQTRIFMAYGPGQHDQKVVPYTILSLLDGNSPVIRSRERLVDWIFIDDVVDGILAASLWSHPDRKPVDIGSGVGTSVEAVAEKIRSLIQPDCPVRFEAMAKRSDEVVRVADIEATHRRIGWRPRVSLDDGLRKTIAWYEERHRAPGGNKRASHTGPSPDTKTYGTKGAGG